MTTLLLLVLAAFIVLGMVAAIGQAFKGDVLAYLIFWEPVLRFLGAALLAVLEAIAESRK